MFQSYEAPAPRPAGDDRLDRLRAAMKSQGIDALLVPHADEQRNEYLPPNAERLAWLTGFTGSAGEALVTADRALLFVDGRYTLQAADQAPDWDVESLIDNPAHTWIKDNLPIGSVIGYDAQLHTLNEVDRLTKAAVAINGTLAPTESNMIDALWSDRPAAPTEPVSIHGHNLAGELARDKITRIAASIAKDGADLAVLTDASSVCWLFNIRGGDIAHTPLALARAIVPAEGDPQIFIAREKLDIETRAYLTQIAEIETPEDFNLRLRTLSDGATVLLDPDLSPDALREMVEAAGGTVKRGKDPVRIPRAIKNETELAGSRSAHLRDGAAMTTFLAWLDAQMPGSIDEITAAKKLEDIRTAMAAEWPLRDISFDTISGSGPNGAVVHYRVTEATNRTLQAGELYLSDSGGQYEDGTTDITRTVAIGEPSDDQRRAFTLVLRGHIAIATARFPKGTRGVDIDALARIALWQHGMDYAHGTGHGVGSYLSVHEGPQNISRRGMQELLPGMIVSNEPGYYRAGEFGIRIENLVLVTEAKEIAGGNQPMLGFETLTLAPIDARLIDPTMMTDDELHWLNAYHGWVRRQLTPLLDDETAEWLANATQPLSRELPAASA